MPDLLPLDTIQWSDTEEIIKSIVSQYGYKEIRTPILESIEVFKKIGNDTDIIGKEMYQFQDQNDETIVLRPEGTAGVVRAGLQHALLGREPAKLWYLGPMFRYERPQKGRYRQFTQFGVEAFGYESTSIDIEILALNKHIFDILGLDDIQLEINFIGSDSTRQQYKEKLVTYLSRYESELDDDSLRRLTNNPLRILDSKNPKTIKICQDAPKIIDSLQKGERERFDSICQQLGELSLEHSINTKLVRGLDYYNDLVFEFTTSKLGSQSAVSAGGRFDNFIGKGSKHHVPAIGFSIGMERVISLLECNVESKPLLYAFHTHKTCPTKLHHILDCTRRHNPSWLVQLAHQEKSYNAHMKKAQKYGADIIVAVDECNNDNIDIYDMSKPFNDAKLACNLEAAQTQIQRMIMENSNG